eukprot:1336448-Amorphochlora_amoeboformis.AAC.1
MDKGTPLTSKNTCLLPKTHHQYITHESDCENSKGRESAREIQMCVWVIEEEREREKERREERERLRGREKRERDREKI